MEAIKKETELSHWIIKEPLRQRVANGDGVLYREGDAKGHRCPFCSTFVPLQASVCAGCGAERQKYDGSKLQNDAIIFVVVLAVVGCMFFMFLLARGG